jgi:hypothetical protein
MLHHLNLKVNEGNQELGQCELTCLFLEWRNVCCGGGSEHP